MTLILLVVVALALGLSYGLCLQDDAFISFRYARNLVAGHGLVYNVGEPVEGYTNFLWTIMIAGWMKLGFDPVLPVVMMGLVSQACLVLLAGALAGGIGGGGGSAGGGSAGRLQTARPALSLVPLSVAPMLVATDAGLALESVQGLESSFYAALVATALLSRLEQERADGGGWRWPWVGMVCGLAALTRPEGYLLFAVIEGVGLAFHRGRGIRRRLGDWGAFLALTVPHLLFRIAYYGELVPNTFYAKVGASSGQVLRGLGYVGDFAAAHLVLVSLASVGAVSLLLRRRGEFRTWLLIGLCAVVLAYVAAVGGDFKVTWRFILPILVPLAVLAQHGVVAVATAAGGATGGSARSAARLAVVAGLAMLAAACVDTLRLLPKTRASALERIETWEQGRIMGTWLRSHVPPDTVIAIHAAGIVPWYSGLPTIDMWGLSDPRIAHRAVADMGQGMAGHEKTDYDYVFSRRPAIYLPYHGFLTETPVQLMVPVDFPLDFESQYEQYSITIEPGVVLNLYALQDEPLPWAR